MIHDPVLTLNDFHGHPLSAWVLVGLKYGRILVVHLMQDRPAHRVDHIQVDGGRRRATRSKGDHVGIQVLVPDGSIAEYTTNRSDDIYTNQASTSSI